MELAFACEGVKNHRYGVLGEREHGQCWSEARKDREWKEDHHEEEEKEAWRNQNIAIHLW